MTSDPKAYTVTAVTRMIKGTLEETFPDLWVEGEISNYVHHSSGHRYFNLRDENAVIHVTLWRSVGTSLKFEPENGQHVRLHGNISVYEKTGNYQVNCRAIVPVGIGPLELAFRQLHERLTREGLFDESRKRPLPRYPATIGIVTSPTGAAIRDIIQIASRRNSTVQLILYPAQVQGEGAEVTIAAGIDFFNTRNDIDLLIIGRGGGSLEDLWPFNTETTVRAIVRSQIPVISAVGHEIDITLADLASDQRAPTPSAAAELAVWSKRELTEQVHGYRSSLTAALSHLVSHARQELRSLRSRPVFLRPESFLRQHQQYLDSLTRLMSSTGKNRFEGHKNALSLLLARLENLSPLKILARGYSVSRRLTDGALLKSSSEISLGERFETILSNGKLISIVEESQN